MSRSGGIKSTCHILELQQQYSLALNMYTQALELTNKIGDLDTKATLLNNIGMIQRALNQFEPALSRYNEALKIAEKLGIVWADHCN